VSKAQTDEAKRLKMPVAFENPVGMRFVLIPAGSFVRGSPATETDRADDEGPQHKVTLSRAFYMQVHETTNGQWLKYASKLPSLPKYAGDDRPVNYVSLVTARGFVKWLHTQAPGHDYRPPTEAEWEYACRAGTTTPFTTGASITKEQANFGDKNGTTKKVGSFAPNAWGLYDMHGNVVEWCADRYGPYGAEDVADPKGPDAGKMAVLRGGSWVHEAKFVRSAARHQTIPNDEYHVAGLRLVALLPQ
jgi:formylglycine-generating enzyme required for sulfatase activity